MGNEALEGENMKIIRHYTGKKGKKFEPFKRFVVIDGANICEEVYFRVFRGYTKRENNNVLYKLIESEETKMKDKLRGIG